MNYSKHKNISSFLAISILPKNTSILSAMSSNIKKNNAIDFHLDQNHRQILQINKLNISWTHLNNQTPTQT